ncbi:hypothetical protein BDP55DRAFT_362142 [Colletotrichum godetiae]|uniref:Uncharacterized protein n=1 Tax=Colletotrichum godetiae TaxID=1209918 RepID=A0AAJ0AE57_9PEZI|nr:uncharacterized protein BDP55DRAFT_362142 [Colletotrichum godetiae]KAK1659305.1 hypothetical protein BDP55DRAFT_362142 [Colletotrichum godetiae]
MCRYYAGPVTDCINRALSHTLLLEMEIWQRNVLSSTSGGIRDIKLRHWHALYGYRRQSQGLPSKVSVRPAPAPAPDAYRKQMD